MIRTRSPATSLRTPAENHGRETVSGTDCESSRPKSRRSTAQIAQLQSAIDGKPTGDAKSSQRPRGVKADDWSVEMQELQKKRDGILDQISALKDQARHHGVPANALP